jgi:uncharacterized protein YkwD
MSTPRLRPIVLLLTALVAIGTLAACENQHQETVRSAMNRSRAKHGRSALPHDHGATQYAQKVAEDLARLPGHQLVHSDLSGHMSKQPCWASAGENIGYGPSVQGIENAYMASTGHKRNILDTKWNAVGTGYTVKGSTIYTVQVFIKKTC